MHVDQVKEVDLTESLAAKIVSLTNAIWPKKEKSELELVAELLAKGEQGLPEFDRRFLVWEGDRVVAHARTFTREIFFLDGKGDDADNKHNQRGLSQSSDEKRKHDLRY